MLKKLKALALTHRLLLAILVLGLVLRLGALFFLDPIISAGGDLPLFDRMAKNLIAMGDFGGEPAKTYGSPNINPGFILWLALLYIIFGSSAGAILIGQVALGGLLVYGAYLLASLVFNRNAGLLAAFITAIFPPLIILTIEPYNALLYSALFLFSVFFFLKGVHAQRLYYGAIAGAFMGAAALNESIAFYLPLVMGLWLLGLVVYKVADYKRAGLLFLVFTLAFAAVLTPWAIRNAMVSSGEVRLVSKGELQLVTPKTVSGISAALLKDDLLASGMKRMFLFPYGIWRLDQSMISYKDLPIRIWKSERFPSGIIINLFIKVAAAAFHWALFVLALLSAFKFRRYGFLMLMLLFYTAAAGIGYVAYQGGDFDTVSYLSLFIVPFVPLFAVFASGLLASNVIENETSDSYPKSR